ncbi:MAG: GNAT family N-acetyltransferase [Thermoleophilaceae bacterium]
MNEVTIRDGAPADFPSLLELWRIAGSVPTPTDTSESLAALLAFDPDALIVADDAGGVVVGSVIVAWDGWRGSFYRLAVHPDARRRGLARELVRRGEERLTATRGGAAERHRRLRGDRRQGVLGVPRLPVGGRSGPVRPGLGHPGRCARRSGRRARQPAQPLR